MQSISAKNKQTLLDLAVLHCGSIEAAFALALANGKSLTGSLLNEESIVLPDVVDSNVVLYMSANRQSPATELEADAPTVGIGFMIIGTDFIIG